MFKDSCVTRVLPYRLVEESTALHRKLVPSYAGSSRAMMPVDASGMQGLSCPLAKTWGSLDFTQDAYVTRNGFVSDVISPDNTHPFGWMDWEADIDGEHYDSANLCDGASRWTRVTDIDCPKVTTGFLLGWRTAVTVEAYIPFGTASPVFTFSFRAYDNNARPIETPRRVRLQTRIHLTTRDGRPIWERAEAEGNRLRVGIRGHEDYAEEYAVTASNGAAAVFDGESFGVAYEGEAGAEPARFTVMFSLDGRDTVDGLDALAARHKAAWAAYYAGSAAVEGLDTKEAYVYHNSLYLVRAAFEMDKGMPIGHPFCFPRCWRASSFWDAHFGADALMLSGNREMADGALDYLYRVMRPAPKRPFSWMFMYDGTSAIPDENDYAPLVIAAHAMTAVRHYEYYRDGKALREKILPILRRVSETAVGELFSLVDGRWIMTDKVSNDVCEEDGASEINQTYTTLWYLVILQKTADYSRLAGEPCDPLYEEICSNYYLEHDGNEYFHSRGIRACEHKWASWVPMLLYPSEGGRFLDMDLFDKTRARYCYTDLYMEKQNCYQPWTEFKQALSDFRHGRTEEGYRLRQGAMEHLHGPAYFCEIGPRSQSVGMPPYISAHYACITSLLSQFVHPDFWENRLGVFDRVPKAYEGRGLRLRGVQCPGGLLLDAARTAGRTDITLRGECGELELCAGAPWRGEAAFRRVTVDGKPADAAVNPLDNTVTIKCAVHGRLTLVVHQD